MGLLDFENNNQIKEEGGGQKRKVLFWSLLKVVVFGFAIILLIFGLKVVSNLFAREAKVSKSSCVILAEKYCKRGVDDVLGKESVKRYEVSAKTKIYAPYDSQVSYGYLSSVDSNEKKPVIIFTSKDKKSFISVSSYQNKNNYQKEAKMGELIGVADKGVVIYGSLN